MNHVYIECLLQEQKREASEAMKKAMLLKELRPISEGRLKEIVRYLLERSHHQLFRFRFRLRFRLKKLAFS